jgi:hypothetical protein
MCRQYVKSKIQKIPKNCPIITGGKEKYTFQVKLAKNILLKDDIPLYTTLTKNETRHNRT